VYLLKNAESKTTYYVVQPDPRESDLTPNQEDDRKEVSKRIPELKYENEVAGLIGALTESAPRSEFWWWFLLAVIGLLCCEVWMTRRIVRGQ
jgi:hypothetical protein